MANGQPQEPTGEPGKPITPIPVSITVNPAIPGAVPSIPLPVKEVAKTPWEAAIQWLQQQGVSTVLLFSIVLLLSVGVPRYVIPAIQAGYERNTKSYKEVMELQIESHDRLLKQTWDEHGRDRETFKDVMRMPRS